MAETADIRTIRSNREISSARGLLRNWGLFVAIGLLLYGALYALAETRVRASGETNRFFQIAMTPPQRFDHVILGASHAMPLSYGEMEAQIEQASGASIMNLSNEGAGPLVNAFVLDHFLRRHEAENVLYVVDSFAFNSPQWNEERIADSALFRRAPLDMGLIATFADHSWAWKALPEYLSGFAKINALYRLGPDQTDAELTKFDRTWRASERIDSQRIAYLYDVEDAEAMTERYLAEFQALIERVQATGASFTALKVPTPPRYRDRLPGEAAFDARLAAVIEEAGARLVDHSELLPGDENYYDTDHLNRTGVAAYAEAAFVELLSRRAAQ